MSSQCPICQKPIQSKARTDPCGHEFCLKCIQDSQRKNNRCPVCQNELRGIIVAQSYSERTWKETVNGQTRTYKKVVKDGVETLTIHENGRMIFKSVNGVQQAITN